MSTPLRVLFVSSSEQDTQLIVGELQRGGYLPDHEWVDAADTLSIALRRDWDILIVNHSAPVFAAPYIIALVKGVAPYLPLVVIAGDGGEAAAVETMRLGAADSVMRSDLRRLSSVVDRELRKAADGRDQRMAAEVREDGERRAAVELRQGNEARYRVIFDTAGDAIVVADDRGVIQSFNRAAEKAFGYAADEIIGHNVSDLVPEPHRSRHDEYIADYWRTGQAKIIGIGREVQGRRKDGSVFSHDLTVTEWRMEGRRYFTGIMRDLSGRKRTEERFRIAVESAPNAMVMVNAEGRITMVSAQAERLFGYAKEELLGRSVDMLVPDRLRSGHSGLRGAFLAHPEKRAMGAGRDLHGVRKDGSEFPVEIGLNPIETEGGTMVLSAIVDISNGKKAEATLKRTQAALAQAQKMEAMGRLTGGVAHDFNNLLTVIVGNVAAAMDDTYGNDAAQGSLQAIQRAADRGARIIQQLLAFARQQPLVPQLIRASERLRDIADLLDRALRGNIRVEADLPDDLWTIVIDPAQLELALLNIGVNARDAMPQGGTVRLAARNVTYQDFATGYNSDRLAGAFVVITFSDTGSGIPPDLLPRVFEPFVTTKDVGKGSGLGLSQVYGFTHQSGGAASIASEFGKGTTVTLYLPASQNHTRGRAAATKVNDRTSETAVILVVENDADVAEIAVSFLKRSGYAVELVDSAPAALDVLAQQPVDLVFSDVLLAGGMNGIALAQEINLRYSSLPVLLTTGYSEAAIDAEAKGLTIIRKPCSPHAIVNVIAETLRRGSIASAAPGG